MDIENLKTKIQEEVETRKNELIELSHKIHANPETGYKEEKTSKMVADYLEKNDFQVERGVADLPTARYSGRI